MKSTNTKEISYIANFWGSSYYNKPRFFKEKMKGLTKTAILLSEELFDYFSTESGRKKTHKIWSTSEIKNLIGTSRSSITRAIEEIKELGIFLIHSEGENKYKEYGFYVKTIENIALFERVKEDKTFLQLKRTKYFEEIPNNILNYSDSKMIDTRSKMDAYQSEMDAYRSKMSGRSSKMDTCEVPKTIINTDFETSPKNAQETYIKEYYIKEALHNIEEKSNDAMNVFLKNDNELGKENNNNDSTNQKLDTIKNEVNEIPEIIKTDEKTLESVFISDKELDELDRIKQILIYDYGFTDASKIIKQYSVKCFNECIDMTIQAEYDNKIKTSAGAYLRTKLKNWEEIIIDHEKVLSNGKNLPPAKKEVKKTYLMGEISFIEFMKSKKYLTHTFNQDINNAVKCMIYNLHYEKANMIEFKELFTKEMIDAFINQVEVTNRFFSTNLNGLWYRDAKFNDEKTLFWNAFNNPDLLPEPKKLNEKILNDNLFSEIKKKESEKNISDTKDDFIP